MQGYLYSVIPFLAIIIHSIINYSILYPDTESNAKGSTKDYRYFLIVVLVYYFTDAIWGILAGLNNIPLLFFDTAIYQMVMALAVVMESRYVVKYLDANDWFGKFLTLTGLVFFVVQCTTVIINFFVPVFFYFDEAGNYQVCLMRHILIGWEVLIFGLTMVYTYYIASKTAGIANRRNKAICSFAGIMFLASIGQFAFTLLPAYALGFLIGNCVLNIFVYFNEKEEQLGEIKKLNQTLLEYNEIISHAGFGTWRIIIKDGCLPRMQGNAKMQELLGVENKKLSEEEVYSSWYTRIMPSAVPSVQASVQSMLDGNFSENTYKWFHPVKGVIYVRCGGTSEKFEDGTTIISGYHADVTDIVLDDLEQKEELASAKRDAESASRAKSAFLFSMSHDIRTPMNAILGYAELIKKNLGDTEKCNNYLDKILVSGDVLLTLINNVLAIARIESGKETLDEVVVDPSDAEHSVVTLFDEAMENKNIEFIKIFDVHTKYVYADVVKIREIFLNLLSNACKYTPSGGRVVFAIREIPCDKPRYTNIQITVADNGIGMSKDYLPILFDDFTREHTATDNRIQGTGLGMPIVKKLVDLMAGTITVESELGKGTTFVVTLPHRIADVPDNTSIKPQSKGNINLENKRILLAEDNELNAEIAMEVLGEVGLQVERAADGIICVDMLQKAPPGYYDIILMDIQMPNMNGYKATRIIRSMEDVSKANIPIIAMTANAFEEDKKEAFASGMNAHVAKPIDVRILMQEIEKVFQAK